MTEYRNSKRGDVIVGDVVAAAGEGAGLRRQHDELRGADAATVVDVLLDEVRCSLVLVSRGADQADHVACERFGDRYHADELLEVEQLLGRGDGMDLCDTGGGRQIDDLEFVAGTEVVEDGVEEKAVE